MRYAVCFALFLLTAETIHATDAQLSGASGDTDRPTWQIFKSRQGTPVRWRRNNANSRFMVYDGGTKRDQSDDVIWDRETGLLWERMPDGVLRNFRDAMHYCFNKAIGGRRGSRMPTVEELATLSDPTQSHPALPVGHPFNFDNLTGTSSFQSSTTSVEGGFPPELWYVLLQTSGEVGIQTKASARRIMCVRGGQGFDGNSDE